GGGPSPRAPGMGGRGRAIPGDGSARRRDSSQPVPKGESMTTSAIEVEGLVRSFGKVRALDGIDMVVGEGTVFGLLGPNGAGKTTAIRVLSTLLVPDAGRARVGG